LFFDSGFKFISFLVEVFSDWSAMVIELLRGLAAFMVLVCHYYPLVPGAPAGLAFLWSGVDLFFVISGFVFAPMLLGKNADLRKQENLEITSWSRIKAFFIRRFFRIYPLYVLALLGYFCFAPAAAEKVEFFWRHLFFLHTTRSYEEAYYFNSAFWTLPAEVEYYLFLPLLALIGKRKHGLVQIFCITLLINVVANVLKGNGENNWLILSVHLPALLPEFLAGVYLYSKVQQARLEHKSWLGKEAISSFVAGAALITYAYLLRFAGWGWDTITLLNAPFNFVCAVGYALMIYPALLLKDPSLPPAVIRIALWAGASSYGVYLLHNLTPKVLIRLGLEPIGLPFVTFSALLTYAVVFVLYYLYENPLRKLGRPLSEKVA
jgi:exopolysaccharide production protein ExoZ